MGRHKRFLWAFGLGAAIAASLPLAPALRVLAGANGFFACYLGLMLHFAQSTSAPDLQRRAAQEDEGIVFILLLALGSVLVSLTAIYLVLNGHQAGLLPYMLALIGVPLGWAMLHVLAGFTMRIFITAAAALRILAAWPFRADMRRGRGTFCISPLASA